jgi:hypothetical protein
MTFEGRTRADYVAEVSRPGKFEREAPYVPYFWDVFLEGGADRDDGRVMGFDITAEDKALFPELKQRRTVNLIETDAGFVCEVQS